MPFVIILLILVPFLIAGQYYKNRNYNALSANPAFTKTVVSETHIMKGSPSINYTILVDGKKYKGGCSIGGFSVGDSIGVVYQKDNPKNNMPVFEYYDGAENGTIVVIVIIIVVLSVYRWWKINKKYNDRCPVLERSGACNIYRMDKEYMFVTAYGKFGHNDSYPIKFMPIDCSNGEFEDTLMEIFDASLHNKYIELKAAELIKAMKQRSWRQLYMHSTSVFVHFDRQNEQKLIITPTKPIVGKSSRGLDWDYDRSLSFNLDNSSWKDIINSIRKLLQHNETGR